MGYPIPFDAELYFQYSSTQKSKKNLTKNPSSRHFSRDKKSEYLDEYQKVIAEANAKLNEVLDEKETYTIQTMDMNTEIENCIENIDSKDFDKIEMLMFMDNE